MLEVKSLVPLHLSYMQKPARRSKYPASAAINDSRLPNQVICVDIDLEEN